MSIFKSTTNLIIVLVTLASIWFILIDMVLDSKWIELSLDPLLAWFFSSILWFIVSKKWAKKDWALIVEEEIQRQTEIRDSAIPVLEEKMEDKIDNLLWITK